MLIKEILTVVKFTNKKKGSSQQNKQKRFYRLLPDKKGNWNHTQVSVFKISAQLIIHRFKIFTDVKNFQVGIFSPS